MSQPPTPSEEPRSPGSVGATNPSAFIYPMRSAVSVKPMVRNPSSDSGSNATRRSATSSVSGSNDKTRTINQRTSFDLRMPSDSRVKKMSPSGANLEEITRSNIQEEEDDDEEMGESASQSWTEEEEEAETQSKSSHRSIEESRRMKEGGQESNRDREESKRLASKVGSSSKVTEAQSLETMTQPRFRHIQTQQGHMVVTGRDGEIQTCEEEPIHIPGAVQSFGCMVVVREDEEGVLVVRQASEVSITGRM
jgi:hypothetical protein